MEKESSAGESPVLNAIQAVASATRGLSRNGTVSQIRRIGEHLVDHGRALERASFDALDDRDIFAQAYFLEQVAACKASLERSLLELSVYREDLRKMLPAIS